LSVKQPQLSDCISIPCVQAAAAEEAVLWDLTTKVIDAAYDIQAVLDMVSLLLPCSYSKCSNFRLKETASGIVLSCNHRTVSTFRSNGTCYVRQATMPKPCIGG
jgi:hypothetical protein